MSKTTNKNKQTTNFSQSTNKPIIKKDSNNERPERDSLLIFNKTKNGLEKSQWVRLPIDDKGKYVYVEVAAAELYRALGPINGAPKTRLEINQNKEPVVILSKYDPNFNVITQLDIQKLKQHSQHIAECFVMMYLNEGLDVNLGNFDIERGVRIDFEYDFIDFTELAVKHNDLASSFHHEKVAGRLFNIHPLDLQLMPNLHIAKPLHVLNLDKSRKQDHLLLQQLNADPDFIKTTHQYFLKALLFDKDCIESIFKLHISDNISIKGKRLTDSFAEYVDDRFKKLKFALVQEPAFLKNVADNFEDYKTKIIKEITQYNATFKEPVINVGEIDGKLNELKEIFAQCELKTVSGQTEFENAFHAAFDSTNDFHQYAMRMLIASQDSEFNSKKLLEQINYQITGLRSYLKMKRSLPLECKCLLELKEILYDDLAKKDHLVQAKILFEADKKYTQLLREKEDNWYKVNQNIQQALTNLNSISKKLTDAREIITLTENEVQYNESMIECQNAAYIQREGEFDNNVEAYAKIYTLLDQSICYADDIKMRGDDLWATAYLEKIHKLLMLLTEGINKSYTPQEIAGRMIIEINQKDEYLSKHNNIFKWLIRSLLDYFLGPSEVKLGWFSASVPLFATEREKKICNIVDAVCELKAPAIR